MVVQYVVLYVIYSDTGTTIPESCIFGELLTLTAVFASIAMVIRYKWVESFNHGMKLLQNLNLAALVTGLISCVGMTMVANFEETSIRAVHFPSSAATFGMGIVYNFMHTEITRRMSPKYSSTCVWIYRLIISMMGLLSFGLLYGFGVGAETKGKKWYGNDTAKKLEWNPEDPGWGLHLASAVSEWIIGLSVILFFLTFTFEFGKIKLRLTKELKQFLIQQAASERW
ncbi:DRAM2 [Bugula neritina]|uniref:DRAM2 n=1 Tax=Bugula neritina TaxID=10212 RepID=A0A7J7JS05_BUGNE|nr:DRAM2 [Bugula neritina]